MSDFRTKFGEKAEAFVVWMQQGRITFLSRYTPSDLYNRYLKWHSGLGYPLNQKYKKKYSYPEFTFYLKKYLETVTESEAQFEEEPEIEKPVRKSKAIKQSQTIVEPEPIEKKIEEPEESETETHHSLIPVFTEKECFEQVVQYTKAVADIKSRDYALLISGDPGLGKSFEVETTLKEVLGEQSLPRISGEGYDKIPDRLQWIEGPTKIPPKELYCFLWAQNGRVIVFDDADDFLENPTSVNIMKKVLDSKQKRTVGYGSKPIILKRAAANGEDLLVPNSFDFYGRVIVITNKYFRDIDSAIKSRSLVCEVDLPPGECLKRIQRLKPEIIKQVPNASERTADEVLNHLHSISHLYRKLDLRTFRQALEERIRSPQKWKRSIERSVFIKNKK